MSEYDVFPWYASLGGQHKFVQSTVIPAQLVGRWTRICILNHVSSTSDHE